MAPDRLRIWKVCALETWRQAMDPRHSFPLDLPATIPRGKTMAAGHMWEETTMSEQARALVLRHHDEIWSRGNLAAVDEVYAPEFVSCGPEMPETT